MPLPLPDDSEMHGPIPRVQALSFAPAPGTTAVGRTPTVRLRNPMSALARVRGDTPALSPGIARQYVHIDRSSPHRQALISPRVGFAGHWIPDSQI